LREEWNRALPKSEAFVEWERRRWYSSYASLKVSQARKIVSDARVMSLIGQRIASTGQRIG